MGQDVYENEMKIVNGVDYIRALVGKDSVAITPANLLSGLFQDRGAISNGDDLNKYVQGMFFIYPEGGTVLNGPSFVRFILLCFLSGSHVVQFAVNVHPGQYNFMYRTSHDNGGMWNPWKSISIT